MNILINLTITLAAWIAMLNITSCQHRKYQGFEADLYTTLDQYGCSIAKKHKMQFLTPVGVFNSHARPPSVYSLTFSSTGKKTLNECRIFATELVEQFYAMITTNRETIKYAKRLHNFLSYHPTTPTLDYVGYKISFWDDQTDRRLPPYIALIEFSQKKFRYYYADPETQKLVPAFEESYEDAIAFKNKQNTGNIRP